MALMMLPGGYIAGRLGRLYGIIMGALLHLLGWLILALAVNFEMLIIARSVCQHKVSRVINRTQ